MTKSFADIKNLNPQKVGLGNASTKNVGTVSGTVAAGDDPRFGKMIGVGQAWQDVAANRASGVTYTNSTGRPIFVVVTGRNGAARGLAYVDSVIVGGINQTSDGNVVGNISFMVPDGSTYSISSNIILNRTDTSWSELR